MVLCFLWHLLVFLCCPATKIWTSSCSTPPSIANATEGKKILCKTHATNRLTVGFGFAALTLYSKAHSEALCILSRLYYALRGAEGLCQEWGIGKSIHDCCFRGVYSFSRVLKAMYFRGGIKLQVWIFAKMRLRSIGSE